MTLMNAVAPEPSVGQKAIQQASQHNFWLFVIYVILLALSALVTVLLFRSGNQVQQAISDDARARIAEAKQGAAEAIKKAGELESSNLTLRGQVATLEGDAADSSKDLAALQIAASNAKSAQQKVELNLAVQQEKTAVAERSLADLRASLEPRVLSDSQLAALIATLASTPKGSVVVQTVLGDPEAVALANQIATTLQQAGWTVPGFVNMGAYIGGDPYGLGILVHSSSDAPVYTSYLQTAFAKVGVNLPILEKPDIESGSLTLLVGHKVAK